MSDLYLVLRSRLEAVTDWVTLGSDVMLAARKRKGLSYESVARLIPVSSKTYERYEKKGQVPRTVLPRVADALELEIEEPFPSRVSVQLSGDAETEVAAALRLLTDEMRDTRVDLSGRLDRLEAAVAPREPSTPTP